VHPVYASHAPWDASGENCDSFEVVPCGPASGRAGSKKPTATRSEVELERDTGSSSSPSLPVTTTWLEETSFHPHALAASHNEHHLVKRHSTTPRWTAYRPRLRELFPRLVHSFRTPELLTVLHRWPYPRFAPARPISASLMLYPASAPLCVFAHDAAQHTKARVLHAAHDATGVSFAVLALPLFTTPRPQLMMSTQALDARAGVHTRLSR
jgi:hypothetical protein